MANKPIFNPFTGNLDWIDPDTTVDGIEDLTNKDHDLLTGLTDDDHSAVYPRYTIGDSPPAIPREGDYWLDTST